MAVPPDGFAYLRQAKLAELAGVSRQAHQGWIDDGYVGPGVNGAFFPRDLVEAILVAQLRPHLGPATAKLLRRLRDDGVPDALADRFGDGTRKQCDAVLDPVTGTGTICLTDKMVAKAVRPDGVITRSVVAIDLSGTLAQALIGFDSFAVTGPLPAERKRGRPRKQADVIPLRSESA
jgi:hypothetical protein